MEIYVTYFHFDEVALKLTLGCTLLCEYIKKIYIYIKYMLYFFFFYLLFYKCLYIKIYINKDSILNTGTNFICGVL